MNTITKILCGTTLLLAVSALYWLTTTSTPLALPQPTAPEAVPDKIETYLQRASIEEKIGQLFIVGHWADMDASTTIERITRLHLGGVILMDAGEEPEAKLPALITSFQEAADQPLFIGIDQEGGVVSRLKGAAHPQTAQPSITTAAEAYDVGFTRGKALAALGITVNFAPVLEQSTATSSFLYRRVFRDPAAIPLLGSQMINGMRAGGVLATAKHYPGHADTADDSHALLPVLTVTPSEYISHTKPFTDTISATTVPLLMTAHVKVPSIDPVYPATLSPLIIQDLRERVGYEGVVVTDDMIMKAITSTWTSEEAAVLALQAGVDIILFAAEPSASEPAIAAVLAAVTAGTIPMETIHASLRRILAVKQSW